MTTTTTYPAGFSYHPDVLTAAEEDVLLSAIRGLTLEPVMMYGRPTKRRIASYGLAYLPGRAVLAPTDAIPPVFQPIRDRAAGIAGVDATNLSQALVTEYPAKASIGMHVDNPSFGSIICGVSLAGSAVLTVEHDDERTAVVLAPRSLYILAGVARSYRHGLTATEHRYSLTFRTVAAEERRR